MVVMTARALDIESLGDRRETKELVLLKILTEKIRLIPVKAVFAVATLAPTTAIYHATSISRLLLTICTLVLRAVEEHLGLGFRLEITV